MTGDNHLFQTIDKRSKNGIILYEGKMINQYEHEFESPQYWIEESSGREALLSKELYRINQFLKKEGIVKKFTEDEFRQREVAGFVWTA